MKSLFSQLCYLTLALLASNHFANTVFLRTAYAQTVPDASLGTESSILRPSATSIGGRAADVVEGGAIRGSTLFHSFSDFNIGAQQQLYFSPDSRITDIFTRVTGGGESQILGTLGVLGNADFFLLNPNGILFGPEAQLDLPGSFLATSADEIAFEGGFVFGTQSPIAPPASLLTVQPAALFFNQETPAPITSEGSLGVPKGERIQLVGGEIAIAKPLANDIDTVIAAEEGLITLGGLAEPGSVIFSPDGSVTFSPDTARANISLTDTRIDVADTANGDVRIYANNMALTRSRIIAGVAPDKGSPNSQAGDVVIDAQGNFIALESTIENSVRNGSQGTSGNIVITTGGDVQLQDADIINRLSGKGGNQNISITAEGDFSMSVSNVINDVFNDAEGDAGNISIRADAFFMETPEGNPSSEQTLVSTGTSGFGDGGVITIDVNALTMIGPGVSGPSGITANAGRRRTGSEGNAGSVFINVAGPMTMTRRGKVESAVTETIGRGGSIVINAGSLAMDDVSFMQVQNRDSFGAPGNITVNVEEAFDIRNASFLSASINVKSVADTSITEEVGNVVVNAGTLRLSFLGSIRLSTQGQQDAGDIRITADVIEIDDPYLPDEIVETASGFFSRSRPRARGAGGDIVLDAGLLRVSGNSVITTETESPFPGGNIEIGGDRILLENGGQILSSASADGEAGDITISATTEVALLGNDPSFAVQVQNGQARLDAGRISDLRQVINRQGANGVAPSGIYLQSLGDSERAGSAGNLVIQALGSGKNTRLVMNGGSEINADTINTTGGNIAVANFETVLLREQSSITAEAGASDRAGNGGNITLSIPNGFLVAVPEENSNIIANAFEGAGGQIRVNALNILGFSAPNTLQSDRLQNDQQSRISASSEFGRDGEVTLETLEIDPSQALIELPSNLADQSNQIAQRCLASTDEGTSAFVITGQGGTSPSPSDIVRNESIGLVDWGDPQAATEQVTRPAGEQADVSARPAIEERPILEAQSWQKGPNGNVVLLAQARSQPPAHGQHSSSCQQRR
ncbi:MAG: S-layer family protein [Cyanobacteria bacterium P01_A01_bin.116]